MKTESKYNRRNSLRKKVKRRKEERKYRIWIMPKEYENKE
jgi:hypothetical protein